MAIIHCKTPKELPGKEERKLLISLQESACLGSCPVFDLICYSDGTIAFLGKKNTAIAETTDTLTTEEFEKLMVLSSMPGIDTISAESSDKIVDAPVIRLKVVKSDTMMEIARQGIEPPVFTLIRNTLEELAVRRGWLKIDHNVSSGTKEAIIELYDETEMAEIINRYVDKNLQVIKRISPSQLYFVISLDATGDEDELLHLLNEDPGIKAAQWNHKLSKRDP